MKRKILLFSAIILLSGNSYSQDCLKPTSFRNIIKLAFTWDCEWFSYQLQCVSGNLSVYEYERNFSSEQATTAMMDCAGAGMNWHWAQLYFPGYLTELAPLSYFMYGDDFENNKYQPSFFYNNPGNNPVPQDYFERYQLINFNKTKGIRWV